MVEAPPPVDDKAARARELEQFCNDLTRIIEAERSGFGALRGASTGDHHWSGETVPIGFSSCKVDGDGYPLATYACRGETSLGADPTLLLPAFDRVAGEVSACLARPAWYPRDWRRGKVLQLGGGERQIVWRDMSTGEAPGVSLKIEEDIDAGAYHVRLAVQTYRLGYRPLTM